MQYKRIIFITEGGLRIGLGHLMRCIAIAEYIRDLKIEAFFIVNNSKAIIDILKRYKFAFKKVTTIERISSKHINNIKDAFILIDSKKNLSRLINNLRKDENKITLIDNITSARFLADNVVYPGECYRSNRLSWNRGRGKVYYGAKYFPLRKELRGVKRKKFKKRKNNILISFGGADHNSLTLKVLKALKGINNRLNIKVLIGPAFKKRDKDKIFKLIKNFSHKTYIIVNNYGLKSLLNNINLCITALGVSIYEFNHLRIPIILLNNYKEDIKDANILERLNMVRSLGYYKNVNSYKIRKTVESFINSDSPILVKKYVDEKGSGRIISIILNKQGWEK